MDGTGWARSCGLQDAAQKPEVPKFFAFLALGKLHERPHVSHMEPWQPGGSFSFPPIVSITTSLRHGKTDFAAPELHSHRRVEDTSQLLQHRHTQAPNALSHAGSLLTPSAASPVGQEKGTETPRTKGTDKFREYLFHPPLRFPALINKVMLQ